MGAELVAALVLAATPVLAESKLKLGVVLPLTGKLADYGPATKTGIDLAVEQINKAGGVLGAPVSVVAADDQTSPQAGLSRKQFRPF